MSEKDVRPSSKTPNGGTQPDSVGLGYGRIESHHVVRLKAGSGRVMNEGFLFVDSKGPYEIPYRALTPKRAECDNLLVPVSLSATHVAYSSIRLEPVFMILGHSSGVAASLAARNDLAVQDVNMKELQGKLESQGQIIAKNRLSSPS